MERTRRTRWRGGRAGVAVVLTLGLGAWAGCEVYDPPPEASLRVPSSGKWFSDTALEVRFTEAVDPATVRVTIWPFEVDAEKDILPDAVPLVADCAPADSPCGEFVLELTDDDQRLEIRHGGAFVGKEGRPFLLDLAAGLTDRSGRRREVGSIFKFQISPPEGVGPVELTLNSGVVAMSADLTDTMAGVYLRLLMDVGVTPTTGALDIVGTVARLEGDVAPNETDPAYFAAVLDEEGWTVHLTGQVNQTEDGGIFMRTDPHDLVIEVLGIIEVRLDRLLLEGTIRPGAREDGRDLFEGFMSAERVIVNGTELKSDGQAGATADWIATGLFSEELPEGLPRLCDAEPCRTLDDAGGDCQLARPWPPSPSCSP